LANQYPFIQNKLKSHYLIDLALKAQEDIRGLDDDMYAFFEVIDERVTHRLPALKDFLGIMG